MKTLSDSQVWTPFIRKLLEKIPPNERLTKKDKTTEFRREGDPKQERRKAPNDGEGDHKGSWALSLATASPG